MNHEYSIILLWFLTEYSGRKENVEVDNKINDNISLKVIYVIEVWSYDLHANITQREVGDYQM